MVRRYAAFYGEELRFDMIYMPGDGNDPSGVMVQIHSDSKTIYGNTGISVGDHRTAEQIALDVNGDWKTKAGVSVGEEKLMAILLDVDHFSVKLNYQFDESETGGIANFGLVKATGAGLAGGSFHQAPSFDHLMLHTDLGLHHLPIA